MSKITDISLAKITGVMPVTIINEEPKLIISIIPLYQNQLHFVIEY